MTKRAGKDTRGAVGSPLFLPSRTMLGSALFPGVEGGKTSDVRERDISLPRKGLRLTVYLVVNPDLGIPAAVVPYSSRIKTASKRLARARARARTTFERDA